VQLNVLWPLKPISVNAGDLSYSKVNNDSLVLKMKYGNVSFLFPADISSSVESSLIKSKRDLHSDVLFVPHHGSYHSSTIDFIKKVSCRYAVISAGKANVFRHPHQRTLDRYKSFPVKLLRTDKDGAITLTTDGTTLHVNTFLKSR
jgi:competence protein ComEC